MTKKEQQEVFHFLMIAADDEIDGFFGFIEISKILASKIICTLADNDCFSLLDDFIEKYECNKYFPE